MTNRIDQPREHDLVGDPILVSGVATAFEATMSYRVHDGHDEVTGFFNVGGGTGEHGQFQLALEVGGAAFALDRVFVEIFESSAEDGSEINKVTVPVLLGFRLVPGYYGYREHVVRRGDTLWSIAEATYGRGGSHPLIVRANPEITDPDVIRPGQVLRLPIGT